MTTEEILDILTAFKQDFSAEYRLDRLGLFGSFARHEALAESDVDIVFETREPNLFRTARLREALESRVGRHVDIVRLRDNMNPSLRASICRDGRFV